MSETRQFASSFFTLSDAEGVMTLVLGKEHLTEDENLEQLDRDFTALVDTYQARKIILDMQSVCYLSSAGIGRLITFHRRLSRVDGRLVLCSLTEDAQFILDSSNLLTYFHVAPSRDEALAMLA